MEMINVMHEMKICHECMI